MCWICGVLDMWGAECGVGWGGVLNVGWGGVGWGAGCVDGL